MRQASQGCFSIKSYLAECRKMLKGKVDNLYRCGGSESPKVWPVPRWPTAYPSPYASELRSGVSSPVADVTVVPFWVV